MRSVPHRVVCLLGLDDGVFPRRAPRDGDDLLLDDPHVGDRDAAHRGPPAAARRADGGDRAADRHLHRQRRAHEPAPRRPRSRSASCSTSIERTAARRRRASGCSSATRCSRSTRATSRRRARPRPRGASTGRARAHALGERRERAGRSSPRPPARAREPRWSSWRTSCASSAHPVRAFLRQRLGVTVAEYDDEVEDALPVELDGLEPLEVGERLLRRAAGGRRAARRRSSPRSRAGRCRRASSACRWSQRVEPEVEAIVAAVAEAGDGRGGLGRRPRGARRGARLSGTVPGVVGDVLRTVTYSRVGARHRLAAWVRLLALTAAHPGRAFEAVTVGAARRRRRRVDGRADRAARTRREAREHLAALLDLYDRGMREPLPLDCDDLGRLRAGRARGRGPGMAARNAWESAWNFDKEDREPEHLLVLGGELTFEELLDAIGPLGTAWPHAAVGTGSLGACGTAADRECAERRRAVRRLRPAADRRDRARGERRAPARRTRSPRSRRATSPRARRWTSSCS